MAGAEQTIAVPFTEAVHERAQIRAQTVVLYERACAAAGIAPRPPTDHNEKEPS